MEDRQALAIAETVLDALKANGLHLVWRPKPPPPAKFVPPKGKHVKVLPRRPGDGQGNGR